MVHAHKTARITTGGYYPPHSQYEPMKPHGEEPEEPEATSPIPPSSLAQVHALELELSPEDPELEVEPVEVIHIDDDDEDAQGGEQPRRHHKWDQLEMVCRPVATTSQAMTLLRFTDW
jgi:hypothetical protein